MLLFVKGHQQDGTYYVAVCQPWRDPWQSQGSRGISACKRAPVQSEQRPLHQWTPNFGVRNHQLHLYVGGEPPGGFTYLHIATLFDPMKRDVERNPEPYAFCIRNMGHK